MSVRSPCVGICVITGNRICIGCHRTLEEISAWPTASHAERTEILARSRQRAAEAEPEAGEQPARESRAGDSGGDSGGESGWNV
jgi:hypothetical protein